MILLDLTKVFDRAVLQSSWSRTSLKPGVWGRILRVASTNGLRPAADLGSLILSLEKAFDGLDNCEERIVTAEVIIICEEIDDDTDWLNDCQRIERQKLGDLHDPITGYVAPLGFISSACGDFLDPDIRGGARFLIAFVADASPSRSGTVLLEDSIPLRVATSRAFVSRNSIILAKDSRTVSICARDQVYGVEHKT